MSGTKIKEPYFARDKEFYKVLFKIMIVTSLQNLINYGVNMADNIMLGYYGQPELSGAAVANQIFFLLNTTAFNFGTAFSVLAAQNWGKGNINTINRLGGILLKINAVVGIVFFLVCAIIPEPVARIFTSDAEIVAQTVAYLSIVKFIYLPYVVSDMIMTLLRNVETVSISFYLSISSLIINVVFNYLLIFGNLGCPELGIKGAAIATVIARLVEVLALIFYLWKIDKKLNFFASDFWKNNKELTRGYIKLAIPIVLAGTAWAIATPIQTALLGKMTADAIAANSVSSTYYQLLKVVTQAMSAGTAVVIGKTIGKGDLVTARAGSRTVEILGLLVGITLGAILFLFKPLILSMYSLTPEAQVLTDRMLIVMCFVMVAMSYEHPLLFGCIRAGGDAKFASMTNMLSMWCLALPLAFMAVYWWHLDPLWVVIFIQSEQLIKCFPTFFRIRQYDKWIKVLAK